MPAVVTFAELPHDGDCVPLKVVNAACKNVKKLFSLAKAQKEPS
jgi:hypothetical protein